MSTEPAFDLGRFMGRVVIHHQVNLDPRLLRNPFVDQFHELDKLLMPMLLMARANNMSGCDVQRRKQRSRSMPSVVVGMPLDLSRSHRQQRLAPIQGLHLALFIDAQHDRTIGRSEVKANHVADFVDEQRIRRELESLRSVGLQIAATLL